jgi:hypothetical protein
MRSWISATMFSEKLHDSRRNLRWIAWERKNRRGDRITEKRMKLVFAAVGLILLIWIAYALSQVSEPRGRVEKGPTVAFLRTIGPLRYCVETARSQASLEGDQDKSAEMHPVEIVILSIFSR